jgi:choline dehydrogenase-like flavoprotein
MLLDSTSVEDGTTVQSDLCIIGAGSAGIAIAREMVGRKHSIILIESGGFELSKEIQDLYQGTTSQAIPSITDRYLFETRLRYFGGTSNHWGGQSRPFERSDFEKRSWIPESGWPLKRSDLTPYYRRAEEYLGLSPFVDGPYPNNLDGTTSSFSQKNPMIESRPFQSAPPKYRLGKYYRSLVTDAPNVTLHLNATVTKLQASADGERIEHVEVRNLAGKRYTVRSKIVVLACGGIENARVLLASNDVQHEGLGNERDLVGRYFADHPHFYHGIGVVGLWPNAIRKISIAGANPTGHFATDEFQRKHQTCGVCLQLVPLPPEELSSSNWNVVDQSLLDFARFIDQGHDGGQARLFKIILLAEQAPNRNSRVTLGSACDPMGTPRTHLDWRIQSSDFFSIACFVEEFMRQIAAEGLGRGKLLFDDVGQLNNDVTGGAHHMGTTRMGSDIRHSVVDPTCKVHGIDNLFIAGSSVFTTSSTVNPTYTLLALALRLADHLELLLSHENSPTLVVPHRA